MIKSMTGFGKAIVKTDNRQVNIEIRTLNSKNADINIRIPANLKEKELIIKKILNNKLERGKIDFTMQVEFVGKELPAFINENLVMEYFNQIKDLSSKIGINASELSLQSVLRFPDVLVANTEEIPEQEWQEIEKGILTAIDNINNFRLQEGEALNKDFETRIKNIENLLSLVEKEEPKRIENIKSRIKSNMDEFLSDVSRIDENRFEQELIYYIEKLDITEEKVRLKNHCKYFITTLNKGGAVGKKLGFISQEIGREINTLGSKANNVEIQHFVIQMKDELEKIKEQVLNVL